LMVGSGGHPPFASTVGDRKDPQRTLTWGGIGFRKTFGCWCCLKLGGNPGGLFDQTGGGEEVGMGGMEDVCNHSTGLAGGGGGGNEQIPNRGVRWGPTGGGGAPNFRN